jgi:hypothetical protein
MVWSCEAMQVIVAGLAATASAAEPAAVAPADTSGSAFSAVRFQTVTAQPFCRSARQCAAHGPETNY